MMESIVLCGGFGTRIKSVGLFFPKALLPIKGRPILDYIVNDLDNLNKIDRIIISTNKKFSDQFRYYIKGKALGMKKPLELVIEPSARNKGKLGSVGGLAYAIKEAKINSDTLVILGDNFYDFKLQPLLKHFSEYRNTTVALYDINSLEEVRKYGVVDLKGKKIVDFEEKPEHPRSTLVSTGIYLLSKDKLNLLDEYSRETNSKDAFGNFIRWHIGREEVHEIKFQGKYSRWFDIGTLETYKKAYETANQKI